MEERPAPYQHFRATAEAPVEQGVYRVVGTPDGAVTLLRVTDDDWKRRSTGHVVQVESATLASEFEPAENPDAGFGVGDIVDRLVMNGKAVFWFFQR